MSAKNLADTKPRKSGVGKLFLGIFLGFILCLGVLFGIGWFAYNNVSIQWINKTFKTDLDISDEMNKKTPKELIASALSVSKNIDTYSLNDIKNDFGFSVDDKLMGIDISDLKDVPIKKLSSAAQDKFSNISADELKDVVNLSDMDLILNKTNTYYVSGDTLYTDAGHTHAVNKKEIDYTLTSTTVKIKDQTRNIQDGKVKFELRYLPLTKALGDFMGTMGDKITIGELVDKEDGFGVELPDYLHNTAEKRAKTINELSDVVDNLYLAEFLGYTISGETVTKDGETITGIVAKLAKKKISELDDIENIINTSTIADVLDYSYDASTGKYYYKTATGREEVKGIMKALAGTQVGDLTEKVDNLYLLDALDYTKYTKTDGTIGYKDSEGNEVTGALTILDLENTKFSEIGTKFQEAIEDKTLFELAKAGVIDATEADLSVEIPEAWSATYKNTKLGNLKINQAIEVLIAGLNTST